MSQTWNVPIDATDLLSDSRVDINDALASLRTHFIGVADPAVLVEGMIWVNTTEGRVKARRNADTIVLGDWANNMGYFRSDGTIAMSGDLDAGGFKLTNLGAPSATADAARKSDVDAKVSKAGTDADRTMSSPLILPGLPTQDNHAATKAYTDLKVSKSGDTLTGRLNYSGALAAPSTYSILSRQEIVDFAAFKLTTGGHDHNGVNSRQLEATYLKATGENLGIPLVANGSNGVYFQKLFPSLALRSFAYGTVNADGTIAIAGSGNWSSVRDSTGIYTITFIAVFAATPAVMAMINNNATGQISYYNAAFNTVKFRTGNALGSLENQAFSFIALL